MHLYIIFFSVFLKTIVHTFFKLILTLIGVLGNYVVYLNVYEFSSEKNIFFHKLI